MPIRASFCLFFFLRAIVDAKPNIETFKNNVLDLYSGNTSLNQAALPIANSFFCPLLLVFLWIVSLCILVCICMCFKLVKSETLTSYDTNSFEMQEIHILEPTFKHVKGCACLECLHRQLAKELEMENGK
ncbi:uncharacterized protein LOC108107498 [Drosophila eugracilis]|uniref:uncharacterized protein LOC108107498 n=1 Tax=Drosophila eugracilis TaxID=29029 RepID=UPI001BDADA1B|nr:uncharacterized protein LOC108107498 [Drosophila eugracilis]